MSSAPAAPSSKPHKTGVAWLWATFFGMGFLRPGPGTFGSIAATLLWYGAFHLFPASAIHRTFETLIMALFVTATGIPAATRAARESGREDPGFVVIDEVAGQLFALLPMQPDWQHALLALVLFRVLDITKPWPIRRLESLPEGMGIMLDDVAAGLLAALVAALLAHFLPRWR